MFGIFILLPLLFVGYHRCHLGHLYYEDGHKGACMVKSRVSSSSACPRLKAKMLTRNYTFFHFRFLHSDNSTFNNVDS